MKANIYYVYILNSVHYIRVTNDIIKRVAEHKGRINKGFTYRYNVDKLVYFEVHGYIEDAILREKRLKKSNRKWKIDLIEKENKDWEDLSLEWYNHSNWKIPDFSGMKKKEDTWKK